jgi:hypothetical protein
VRFIVLSRPVTLFVEVTRAKGADG